MSDQRKYWFPAKRYGWGWGVPASWQGWTVLVLFFALVLLGAFVFLPSRGPVPFLLYTGLLCGTLIFVCWIKGEPLGWRWGDEK
jgi:hypothetical protein